MEQKCAVCGESNPKFSFPLTKKDGKWIVTPVCSKCKTGLSSEAFHAGRSIRFFSLAGSLKEAARRNDTALKFQPFLDAFTKAGVSAKDYDRDNGDKRKTKPKAKAK